jgi:hypothetical protein
MGNTDTKIQLRKAIVQLTSKSSPIDAKDDEFWDQFWSDSITNINDVFSVISSADIRSLREESPSNLATLVYKAVEKLKKSTKTLCNTSSQQTVVLNSCRILTRILPYLFEDPDWKAFFWSNVSSHEDHDSDSDVDPRYSGTRRSKNGKKNHTEKEEVPLGHILLNCISDLLFCPDFTVPTLPSSRGRLGGGPDTPPEDLRSIDSCEYIWESGVGFTALSSSTTAYDSKRTELLRLLLTCFSSCMYMNPSEASQSNSNRWIEYFTSGRNRHTLPLFTSLLNTIISYEPNGIIPFNHIFFTDAREELVEVAIQILVVTLDYDYTVANENQESLVDPTLHDNLFINYLARIHREEDYGLIFRGFSRLLNNPLQQTYLPHSSKKIHFHQELLVFFWKVCDYNKKFMYYVLKSSDVLEILVPILFHLNDSRTDQSRIGLIHIGVFILLLLSGERNFGVRLNKPYNSKVWMEGLPIFTGTHADLLIVVFHKLITTGHQRLQPLFDCLLTIIVNVSPYLKTLTMVSATKLLHLMEAFSTPWFLYSNNNNYHLVFFLLEIFNNIIQYQFDGNSNLVYTIIRKRAVFHALSNLSTDHATIQRSLSKHVPKSGMMNSSASSRNISSTAKDKRCPSVSSSKSFPSLSARDAVHVQSLNSTPEVPTSTSPRRDIRKQSNAIVDDLLSSAFKLPGLAATPKLATMTEKTHAHAVSPTESVTSTSGDIGGTSAVMSGGVDRKKLSRDSSMSSVASSTRDTSRGEWTPTPEWVQSWKSRLPIQTIMRMLQVLVPQVEKMCIDRGITEEPEILKFLQNGTLVGLLPVPHPILIRKYQTNAGTTVWFRTYMWGVIYLRNIEPGIWYDTNVQLFEIHKV